VVGVGIGQEHIKGYKQLPNAEVVALCDVNTERAQQVADANGLSDVQMYTDHREMLEKANLDAVSVCVPNALHRPIVVDSLNAGKHVLCEKPLALNAREAQKIVEAAATNNRKCMVAQVLRFYSATRYMKELVSSGELGNIYYAHAGVLRKSGIPGYGGWFTTKEQSGGGPLIDLGVHYLDLTWWLCGCPRPVAAFGATYAEFGPKGKGVGGWGSQKPKGNFNVEDLAVGMIRFENGLTINLVVSWALHNRTTTNWMELFGSEGGCEWGQNFGIYRNVNGAPITQTVDLPDNDAFAGETGHFIDSILNNTAPDPDATQGVTMMKMLDAIYKSAETKREVVIK
jgi:predicted dehydrogenase